MPFNCPPSRRNEDVLLIDDLLPLRSSPWGILPSNWGEVDDADDDLTLGHMMLPMMPSPSYANQFSPLPPNVLLLLLLGAINPSHRFMRNVDLPFGWKITAVFMINLTNYDRS